MILSAGNSEGLVHLNAATGMLSCEPLDREKRPKLVLNVSVSDGNNSDSCELLINVLDENDNAPKFMLVTLYK